MRFGIFLAPFHPVGQNPTLALKRDLELIEHLDRLGYDEAWIGEHHSAGYEIIASPEVFIAAAAERTRRIKLGTGVSSLPYHHPFMLADRIVLLDHLTEGRFMFGVGPGALPSDAYMMGIEPSRQREMMEGPRGHPRPGRTARSPSPARPSGSPSTTPACTSGPTRTSKWPWPPRSPGRATRRRPVRGRPPVPRGHQRRWLRRPGPRTGPGHTGPAPALRHRSTCVRRRKATPGFPTGHRPPARTAENRRSNARARTSRRPEALRASAPWSCSTACPPFDGFE